VARKLQALGHDAVALKGGFNAWRDAQPVEPSAAAAIA
jgi:rhodanese-related sulfurtransferase